MIKVILPMMMIATLTVGAHATVSSTHSRASHGEASSTRNTPAGIASMSAGGSVTFVEGIASHVSNDSQDRGLANSPARAPVAREGRPSATHSTEGSASHLR